MEYIGIVDGIIYINIKVDASGWGIKKLGQNIVIRFRLTEGIDGRSHNILR